MTAAQSRRSSLLLRVASVAVLSVATVACASGAASPSSPPSSPVPSAPTPSAPPADSPDPSIAPGSSDSPGDPVGTSAPVLPVIPHDSIATIVTDDLRVRSKPVVSADSELFEPLLDRGREVLVVDGPVEASGYTWYLVAPLGGEELPVGWVAVADKTGERWVQPRDAECPAKPTTFAQMSILEPLIALACFGDDEIEFTAQAIRPEATCGVDVGWTIEPDWLASTCPHPDFILIGEGADGDMYAVIEPGAPVDAIDPGVVPEDAVDVVVRGQFDHEASDSCRVAIYEPGVSIEPDVTAEEAVITCRKQFVITSLEAAD